MTTIVVTAAIVERDERFLVTKRPGGSHLAGYWEFPGGKCEPGETLPDCLAREMREELDVAATVGDEMLRTTHAYDDRVVELHFFRCTIAGTPAPMQGQEVRWASKDELGRLRFPPADVELVGRLTGITPGREQTATD